MLRFDEKGLVPVIVQDAETKQVLMTGFANEEAVRRTADTGRACFWSRRRQQLWQKGETSGNYLEVVQVLVDCDDDAVLYLVHPAGPTCHTGSTSCFFRPLGEALAGPGRAGEAEAEFPWTEVQDELFAVILDRKRTMPQGSYVATLLAGGTDRIGRKMGEEAAEVIIAAKNGDPEEITREVADLWFHTLILLASAGLSPRDIWEELRWRRK